MIAHYKHTPRYNIYLLSKHSSAQRNERFSQGGPRGMGPGNPGYGRVREEFDGPSKKPRF